MFYAAFLQKVAFGNSPGGQNNRKVIVSKNICLFSRVRLQANPFPDYNTRPQPLTTISQYGSVLQ